MAERAWRCLCRWEGEARGEHEDGGGFLEGLNERGVEGLVGIGEEAKAVCIRGCSRHGYPFLEAGGM